MTHGVTFKIQDSCFCLFSSLSTYTVSFIPHPAPWKWKHHYSPPSSGLERKDYNGSNWFMGKWLLPWNVKEKEDRSFSVVTALDFQENRKGGEGLMWHSALKSEETRRGEKKQQGRAEQKVLAFTSMCMCGLCKQRSYSTGCCQVRQYMCGLGEKQRKWVKVER